VAPMTETHGTVRVARIYDEPTDDDGRRILVDRLWPRGVSKERAQLDDWCKGVAPSNELRRWYGHVPDRFEEFSTRYRAELSEGEQAEALSRIAEDARSGVVTLLTATKMPEISEAAVIKSVIDLQHGHRGR
jgi:uncharacterized protein YeaO (DUF488 family)